MTDLMQKIYNENRQFIARYSFINQDGLVISKGSIGKIINSYNDNHRYKPQTIYDIEFIVDGDPIVVSGVSLPCQTIMDFEENL